MSTDDQTMGQPDNREEASRKGAKAQSSDGLSLCRKPHECRLCGELIHAGDRCHRWSGFHENKPFTSHAHPECYALTAKWDNGDWESCSPGDVERPKLGASAPLREASGSESSPIYKEGK